MSIYKFEPVIDWKPSLLIVQADKGTRYNDQISLDLGNQNTEADLFRHWLSYDPETGIITAKQRRSNVSAGQIIGSINLKGYLQISLCGRVETGQRVAWFLYYGYWPDNEIDHMNGIRNDNRISNLRDVTRTQNMLNTHKHRSNKKDLGIKQVNGCGYNVSIPQYGVVYAPTLKRARQIRRGAMALIARFYKQ